MSIEGFNGEERYYPQPASNKHKGDPMSNPPQEPPHYHPHLTVPCGLCGIPTAMLGTKRCHPCWQLEQGIAARPVQARQLLGVATLVAQRDRLAKAARNVVERLQDLPRFLEKNDSQTLATITAECLADLAVAIPAEQADESQAGGGSEG